MPRQNEIKQLIKNHNRRLQVLKEKQALKGLDVEPAVILEIQGIEAQIEDLQAVLKEIATTEEPTPQIETTPSSNAHPEPQLTAETRPRYIFISYKRNVEPDEPLALAVHQALVAAGHSAFIDQDIPIGVEWADEIRRQIEASDFVLVFLSEASVHSEMVAKEIEFAHKHHQQTGQAHLLPVRVNYTGLLPYQLSHCLDKLQYAAWSSEADNERLVKQLLEAINDIKSLVSPPPKQSPTTQAETFAPPQPYADPRFIETLREPSGAVRLRSEFYVEREADDLLSRELAKKWGTTTTIRAPRQTGKSSLLIRGIAQARTDGTKVVLIDLQPVDDACLESLDTFLRYFAEIMVVKLGLDPTRVEKQWQSALGPADKATYLMEGYILPEIDGTLVLAIDEADRLLGTAFHDTFFGLLRFWHNQRAMNDLWENLDIVLVISTEPHLLISDVTQSPFNVGLKLRLQDFDENQVRNLNHRHRSPLGEQELSGFMAYLGGHPYLTRKALYTMITEKMTWPELVQVGSTEQSPFGDHLRRYLWLISQQSELREALEQVIRHGPCPDETAYYRLLRAGLIKGESSKACTCRCKLYELYLKDRL